LPTSDTPAYWIILSALILLVLTGVSIAAVYFISWRSFHDVFDRPFPRPAYDRSPMEIRQDTIYGRGQNWFYTNRLDFQDLQLRSYDGLDLFAYYRPARVKDNRKLVIFMHGWKDTASSMAAFAQLYLEKTDCHILIPHMRTHGMSGGRYIGFGLPDSQDILMWTSYMEEHLQGPLTILYHGWSMGAAAILIAAGSGHLSQSVAGVVVDSPYASFESQLRYNMKRKYHFAPGFLLTSVDHFIKKNLGYSIRKISPIARARKIEVPVLMIHGTKDTFVPTQMSEALFERIHSPKRLLLVQDAEHVMSYDVAPSTYSSEVEQFLRVCGFIDPVEV